MKSLSERYPLWLCDIWGVVHDGRRPLAANVDTLVRHRRGGGTVVLVSNSPRTCAGVKLQLDQIGVDPKAYDAIVTSGDVTRDLIVAHGRGLVYHLGHERSLSILDGLDVARVPPERAHAILCTGLFDDAREQPGEYRSRLAQLRTLGLPMICANPDKVVRVGDRLLPCAGALAEIYEGLGGKVLMAGKPHPPIYASALSKAAALRGPTPLDKVLAIGDGPETDLRGAADLGVDSVFVADGITDASHGLANLERMALSAVPHARIVATVRDLAWT